MKFSVHALSLACLGLLASGSVRAAALPPERVNGMYVMKDGPSSGTLGLELLPGNKLRVALDLSFVGLVGSSTGAGGGEAPLKGNVATLVIKNEWQSEPCVISLSFEPANTVRVSQKGSGSDCGFGSHVTADGAYAKVRGGKASRTPLPTGKAADPRSLAAIVKEADAEIAPVPELIQTKRPRIDVLLADRKQLLASLSTQQREFEQQSRSATNAIQRYKKAAAAPKPPVKPSLDELLSAAQNETTAALRTGQALLKSRGRLSALEDELVQLVAEVKQAASDAKLALEDRQKASLALDAALKKPGTTQEPALKEMAKKTEADARSKVASAATAATSAQSAAGLSPSTYAARRAKAQLDLQKPLKQVQALQAELSALKAPAPAAAVATTRPGKAPLKQCDLHKVDWNAWFPATSKVGADGDEEFGVTGIEYADLDGDGSAEALVSAMYSQLGLTASQHWTLHVMTHEKDCTVTEAGSLEGNLCADTSRSGNLITFNNGCEGFVAEYRLLQGTLKETKRRAQ